MSRKTMTTALGVTLGLWVSVQPTTVEGAERLLLLADVETRTQQLTVGTRKPFTVTLVAERDADKPQVSTVAFKLEVPDGLVLMGEELLVESLLALGTPRTGMHLAFHCVESPRVSVYRFKLVATRPLERVVLRTLPEDKTNFLGIVACRDENFAKWACEPAVLTVTSK
jgi:hypothetical protein